MGIQGGTWITGVYKGKQGLQGYTGVHMGIQAIARDYKRI